MFEILSNTWFIIPELEEYIEEKHADKLRKFIRTGLRMFVIGVLIIIAGNIFK